VEAVEYFLLPLPSLLPLPASSKCFRFHKNLTAFCFHIHAPCFITNASVSSPSKSQMFLSLLPLLASFFKVLPLPQKFNRFHIPELQRPEYFRTSFRNSHSWVVFTPRVLFRVLHVLYHLNEFSSSRRVSCACLIFYYLWIMDNKETNRNLKRFLVVLNLKIVVSAINTHTLNCFPSFWRFLPMSARRKASRK